MLCGLCQENGGQESNPCHDEQISAEGGELAQGGQERTEKLSSKVYGPTSESEGRGRFATCCTPAPAACAGGTVCGPRRYTKLKTLPTRVNPLPEYPRQCSTAFALA